MMEEKEIKTLGELLKFARISKGISQEGLAKKCDITRNSVYSYEIGRRRPSKNTLKVLCVELDIDYLVALEFLEK